MSTLPLGLQSTIPSATSKAPLPTAPSHPMPCDTKEQNIESKIETKVQPRPLDVLETKFRKDINNATTRFLNGVKKVVEKQSKGRRKKTRDPRAPRQPHTPFFRYLIDMYTQFKTMYPNMKTPERARMIAHHWYKLSPEEQNRYRDGYATEKIKYDKEMEAYRQKLTQEREDKNAAGDIALHTDKPADSNATRPKRKTAQGAARGAKRARPTLPETIADVPEKVPVSKGRQKKKTETKPNTSDTDKNEPNPKKRSTARNKGPQVPDSDAEDLEAELANIADASLLQLTEYDFDAEPTKPKPKSKPRSRKKVIEDEEEAYLEDDVDPSLLKMDDESEEEHVKKKPKQRSRARR